MNVAWDGGDHAFLIDTKVRPNHQRQGIGTELVRIAARHAKAAGCEWMEVDFDEPLAPFYYEACGFVPTPAGLLHLPEVHFADPSWPRCRTAAVAIVPSRAASHGETKRSNEFGGLI